MPLTTHQQIRVEAGFQNRFVRQSFQNNPDGNSTLFYVQSDDNYKIVPDLNTGSTVAGISDVQVYCGLSGIFGSSQLGVSSLSVEQGYVELATVVDSGASLTINYASSSVGSDDIENMRKQAESIVNQRLSLCYDLPISPTPSVLTSLATRLAAALLLIRGYGVGSRSTSNDGYALYEKLMGNNEDMLGARNVQGFPSRVGEIGLICTAKYQLVDDNGEIIPRNDAEGSISSATAFIAGGRVRGRLHDITDESFRFKESQVDANTNQAGSGNLDEPKVQS